MFRDYINQPIDPISIEYINTLSRLEFEPDFSLTCLGIALLKPRLGDNYKGIAGGYLNFENENTCVDDFLNRSKNVTECPTFYYYIYSNKYDNDDEIKEKLKAEGFKIKDSIGALLKDKADTKCIAVYHEEKNIAAIIINSVDRRLYHMLISFLSLLFPALFKDMPLQEQDYNLIKSLSKSDKDVFIQRIKEAVEPYAMEFKRVMLGTLLRAMHETKVAGAKVNVDTQRRVVDDFAEKYAEAIGYLKQLIVTYEGMKATEFYGKPEEELVEYLATNKLIHNMSINGTFITFTVATLLNNYNSDAWSVFSQRGYIYDGKYGREGRNVELLDVFKDQKNRKLLLDNIFNESPEFAIKIAGNYKLDFQNCRPRVERDFDYVNADPMYKSYLPNPHLKIFSCLGGYEDKIMNALRDRDYILAIELCCASAGSVDLDETEQTFRPFLGWIMMSREKILRRKDGEEMTPEEALLYLIDKEKNK